MSTNYRTILHSSATLVLVVCAIMVGHMSERPSELRVSAWNSRGLSVSRRYLGKLLEVSDIVAMSEHHLYEAELHKLYNLDTDFASFGKCSEDLKPENYGRVPGHCGVAIM